MIMFHVLFHPEQQIYPESILVRIISVPLIIWQAFLWDI